jgi:hypothetical protein
VRCYRPQAAVPRLRRLGEAAALSGVHALTRRLVLAGLAAAATVEAYIYLVG